MGCKIAGRQAGRQVAAAEHFERLRHQLATSSYCQQTRKGQPSGETKHTSTTIFCQTAAADLIMNELKCLDTTNSEFVHMLMERLDKVEKEHDKLKDFATEQLAPVGTIVRRTTSFKDITLTHLKTSLVPLEAQCYVCFVLTGESVNEFPEGICPAKFAYEDEDPTLCYHIGPDTSVVLGQLYYGYCFRSSDTVRVFVKIQSCQTSMEDGYLTCSTTACAEAFCDHMSWKYKDDVHGFELWWLNEAEELILDQWQQSGEVLTEPTRSVLAAAREKMIRRPSFGLQIPWVFKAIFDGLQYSPPGGHPTVEL